MNDKKEIDAALQQMAIAKLAENHQGELVVARIPQGFEANITIRIVPGVADIPVLEAPCQPRQGGRAGIGNYQLPGPVLDTIRAANSQITEWLAQDTANPNLFMSNPVQALDKAGVKLSPEEQKELQRVYDSVNETTMIPPGVRVKLNVVFDPKGSIGGDKKEEK